MTEEITIEITQADINAAGGDRSGFHCPYAQALMRMGYQEVQVGFGHAVALGIEEIMLPEISKKIIIDYVNGERQSPPSTMFPHIINATLTKTRNDTA
jgi:hypothetical protein